jgi:hypothetical protein
MPSSLSRFRHVLAVVITLMVGGAATMMTTPSVRAKHKTHESLQQHGIFLSFGLVRCVT